MLWCQIANVTFFVLQILYSDSENVKSDAPESDVDLDAGTN